MPVDYLSWSCGDTSGPPSPNLGTFENRDAHMPIVNRLVCRERELAAVKVDVKDVEFIVQQLEVSKDAADRSLREHKVRLVLW
jgi:hypothetical protein